jgi:hypothetical protein
MNNVNSISQMNSLGCEHSSLINHDKKPDKGPDGRAATKPNIWNQ